MISIINKTKKKLEVRRDEGMGAWMNGWMNGWVIG